MEDDDAPVRHQRARPRLKVFHPVDLRDARGTMRAHLLDLSGDGALAYCNDPPAVGEAIVLVLADRTHSASVMWRDGRRFGIAFKFRLSDAEIDRVTGAQSARPSATLNR